MGIWFVVATPPCPRAPCSCCVSRAGLVDALNGPLFAPPRTMPLHTVSLLISGMISLTAVLPHLRDLLLYHVLLGEFFAADLVASTRDHQREGLLPSRSIL
jgi:hypothetical protein